MRKVLLAVEDYSELVFLETLFKKVGLDVDGVQNDVAIPEKLLGMDPDLLILSAYGTRVNAVRFLSKFKKKGGFPRVIVLFQRGRGAIEKDFRGSVVDALLESPVHPPLLIEATERLLDLPEQILLHKMERVDLGDGREDDNALQHIKGGKAAARAQFPLRGTPSGPTANDPLKEYKHLHDPLPEATTKKRERYAAIAESAFLPPHQKIGLERINKIEKEFREQADDKEVADIDKERMAFTNALFKK